VARSACLDAVTATTSWRVERNFIVELWLELWDGLEDRAESSYQWI
jgi:hypothetical protein